MLSVAREIERGDSLERPLGEIERGAEPLVRTQPIGLEGERPPADPLLVAVGIFKILRRSRLQDEGELRELVLATVHGREGDPLPGGESGFPRRLLGGRDDEVVTPHVDLHILGIAACQQQGGEGEIAIFQLVLSFVRIFSLTLDWIAPRTQLLFLSTRNAQKEIWVRG